jgi:hypothetical protein
MFGMGDRFPGPDTWRSRGDAYAIDPTCSYCGSIQPEALFAAIEAGAEIGPTDKNYKVYVAIANPTPDAIRVTGGSFGPEPLAAPSVAPGSWTKRESEMTAEERATALRCGWDVDRREPGSDPWIIFGPAGPKRHGKFYFQHLDEAGQRRFIDVVNAKVINFGYPGYLYSLPFFMRRATPAEAAS